MFVLSFHALASYTHLQFRGRTMQLAHEPACCNVGGFVRMSLLNMFCAICQKAGDKGGYPGVCSSHWLVRTPVFLLSLFPRVVPFRRPELGVYCVGVHLLIRISCTRVKSSNRIESCLMSGVLGVHRLICILHPSKILESNRLIPVIKSFR